MCSQYEIKTSKEQITQLYPTLFTINGVKQNIDWDTHIYPQSISPIVAHIDETNILSLMQYSLLPHWSKTQKINFSTYNARLDRTNEKSGKFEYIYNSPTWKKSFATQHCIVPLTSFFESCRVGKHAGHIVQFANVNNNILLVAGIWDTWTNYDTGQIINSFAIITDDPCDYIQTVGHDRQPVFLTEINAKIWLESKFNTPSDAYIFLKNNQQPVEYTVNNYKQLKGFAQNDLFS